MNIHRSLVLLITSSSTEKQGRVVSRLVFPNTFKEKMASQSTMESSKVDRNGQVERTMWMLNSPRPPSFLSEFLDAIREKFFPRGNRFLAFVTKPGLRTAACFLEGIFPILHLFRTYNFAKFRKDLLAGLALASLCIPQSIGYAILAKLDPRYGLYTSIVPPLIYAFLGTSREVGIGPVAVISLIMSSMIQKIEDPVENPVAYRKLMFTATFLAGMFQAAFGFFKLGILIDFLSHAAIVGFMAGAAIVIGLQQLKGLLGLTYFTNNTDVVSVVGAFLKSSHNPWNPLTFILGCSFLTFILASRFLARRNKKLFWLPAIAPLISLILSTLIVYLIRADKHGVKIVKHVKGGLNQISINQLQLNSPHIGELTKTGILVALVGLTEAIAVSRSFASIKGYHLDGNKEMLGMGFANIVGSITSCYAATGSFSRTAVNFSAGCESVMSNIVMALTVLVSMELFMRLLYFTPITILSSIILSSLPGLIDLSEAHIIWKVDKLDFLACAGAFFGVLFASFEIGLLVAILVSFAKIVLISIQSGTETLGRLPGTDVFCNVDQYPMAVSVPSVLVVQVKSALLCFANANSVRERIVKCVIEQDHDGPKGVGNAFARERIRLVILDMSNLTGIDTSGIGSLKELHKELHAMGTELALANPRWQVIHKLRVAKFVEDIGQRIFLSVEEAVDVCISSKVDAA